MKLLAVFFLLGLALASAVPLSFDDDIESEIDEISDELEDEFIIYAEGGLAQRLRERIEKLIEEIKNKFDKGESSDSQLEKLVNKAKEYIEKLKNYGFELSEKFKQMFEELREKISGGGKSEIDELYAEGGFAQRLRERIEKLIEEIKNKFDKGESSNSQLEKLVNKAKEYIEKLKNYGIELSEKFKQMFEELREKISGGGKSEIEGLYAESGFAQRLRERIEKLIEEIKNKFDKGESSNSQLEKLVNKAKEYIEKLKNYGIELSEKFKQMFEELREKISGGGNSAPGQADLFNFKDLLRKLREKLQKEFDVEKIRDQIEGMFGKSEITNQLLKIIEEKGGKARQKVLDFINRFIGDDDETKVVYVQYGIFDQMKQRFEDMVTKMKENMDSGKGVSENYMKKAQDVYDKLSNLGVEISDKIKQIFEEIKSKFNKSAPQHVDIFNIKDLLRKLRDRLQGEFDVEKMRDHIESVFGKSEITNQMIEMIKDKGGKARERLLNFINKILGEETQEAESSSTEHHSIAARLKERLENLINRMNKNVNDGKGVRGDLMKKANDIYEKFKNLGFELSEKFKSMFENLRNKVQRTREDRSIKEIYEKVKNYFKDLNIELKERFTKFGEYIKEQYQKGLDKSKTKLENIKQIAKEFLHDGKNFSKDMAEEALEFFRDYKNDLGKLYEDIRDKVRDIIKKEA